MKLCFIDVETTGTDYRRHGIIQLAGQIIKDHKLVSEFDYRMRPASSKGFEPEALRVNGIDITTIKTYQYSSEVYKDFIELLNTYVDPYDKKDKLFFVAYNSSFDSEFVRQWMSEEGSKYSYGSYFWTPDICVMREAGRQLMKIRETLPNFKLETVAKHLGVDTDVALHDALVDIKLTRLVWEKLQRYLWEKLNDPLRLL
jgi:DNA polymerase III epsilon subunit-like protein